jgi:hypothetical protein
MPAEARSSCPIIQRVNKAAQETAIVAKAPVFREEGVPEEAEVV